MFTAPTIDWGALSPIIIVLGAAVIGVLVEAFAPARARRPAQLVLTLGAMVGVLVAVALLWSGVKKTGGTTVLGGSLLVDGPTLVLWATIAVLALVSLLIVADRTETGEDAFAPNAAAVPGSDYEDVARRKGVHQTEIYPLVLFATGGMLIFPAAGDLLTLFVALEVLSLPLYLLVGMARRRRLLSQEASMKYFLLGAFASALFLFGIALIYGYSGSLRYSDIATATGTPNGMEGLLLVGAVLILSGLLFKVGAVPFHTWTPDVYQGAPTPITGFMAACTKVAAFGALLRIVYTVFPGLSWDLGVVLWTVAILTMVVGTAGGLLQTDMKRILGYSSIAHAGFILVGIIALNQAGITAVLFYLLVYGAATVGAFGIVWLVRERTGQAADGSPGPILGEATHLSQWAGLGRTNPVLAVTFSLFMLSFAGIPLTSGFIGKFGVFSAAVKGGAWPLALIGVVASVVAVSFYVRIIVLMFFTDPAGTDESTAATAAAVAETSVPAAGEGTAPAVVETLLRAEPEARSTISTTVVRTEGLAVAAIAICAFLTVLLGVAPSPVIEAIQGVASFLP